MQRIDNSNNKFGLFKSNSRKKNTYIYIYVCVYLILFSQLPKLFGGIDSIKFLFINSSQ